MKNAAIALAIFAGSLIGIWGFAHGTTTRAALAERIKSLETKTARLEGEGRAVAAARDQLRQSLTKAEEHIQKLQVVVKERDELKIQLKSRIAERDQVAGQYEQFRLSVRDLVHQADATALRFPDGEPVTINVSLPRSRAVTVSESFKPQGN